MLFNISIYYETINKRLLIISFSNIFILILLTKPIIQHYSIRYYNEILWIPIGKQRNNKHLHLKKHTFTWNLHLFILAIIMFMVIGPNPTYSCPANPTFFQTVKLDDGTEEH